MNSRERVRRAMATGTGSDIELPDRVPVFCQLSVGHYFLHSGLSPFDIWFRSEGFADALLRLRERYQFDGVLVNLPGRSPDVEKQIQRMEEGTEEIVVRWKNGDFTVVPRDDNPHYFQADGERFFPEFEDIDPEVLYYVEPWDVTEITYPYTWDFDGEPRSVGDFFPPYHLETLQLVRARVGEEFSVHSEIFSPFSQLLELLNYEKALLAILDDPRKVHACLERLTLGALDLARRQASCGVDAVLISSAFAGAGLISREHYREFVLPYEQKIVRELRREFPAVPVYTHTCGSIGDRLDLMLATGTQGIDTLDPPPLGTVELDEAKRILAGKAFIKGNLDPVHTLLNGDPHSVREDASKRIRIAMPGGGYILSSACSVAPAVPPENLEILTQVAEEEGRYA